MPSGEVSPGAAQQGDKSINSIVYPNTMMTWSPKTAWSGGWELVVVTLQVR